MAAAAMTTADAPAGRAGAIRVRVDRVTDLAEGIRAFDLVEPTGGELPAFTAGAHIDVHLPGGLIRQYSLCNAPSERNRYVIAVLRERDGGGGSAAMHDEVDEGSELWISQPRNNFPVSDEAGRFTFIAGGIGITPILSMLAEVQSRGKDFMLYFCTRSPERTPFLEDILPLVRTGKAVVHHDHGDLAQAIDLDAILCEPEPGEHLYYCGPTGLMDAIDAASAHWPEGTVHFERFTAPADTEAAVQEGDSEFEIEVSSTGEVFTVPADQTIVEVLAEHGIEVDVSCQEGYCGTCMTRYLGGKPVHRDSVLDEEDRQEFVMICCARSQGQRLVLDI